MDRYVEYMNKKRPSVAFLNELEDAMISSWRKRARVRLVQKYVTITAAFACVLIGIVYVTTPNFEDVIASPQNVFSASESEPSNAQIEPYLPLYISDTTVQDPKVGTYYLYGALVAGVNQNVETPIYAEASNGSHTLLTLHGGDCCWIYDVNAEKVNGLTKVRFWDEKNGHMDTGWVLVDDSNIENSLTEELFRPGWLAYESGVLRYGRDDSAEVVCDLSEGQNLYLIMRNGNWILASTAPFSQVNDINHMPEIGWIKVEEIVVSNWAENDRSLTVVSDNAVVYDRPNGEVCITVPATYAGNLRYEDETLNVYGEIWYRVSYMNIETNQERVFGYVLDSQVKLSSHYEDEGDKVNSANR